MTKESENRPPQQKNPEESKMTRKIKAMRAEDFKFLPNDDDEPVVFDEKIKEGATNKSETNPPPYVPFDPKEELKKIHSFLKEERNILKQKKENLKKRLTAEEQAILDKGRADRRERLTNFKENLVHQKEGIAKTIDELYKTVEKTPDIPTEDLLAKVKIAASEYKFSPDQLVDFNVAIKQYEIKHAAVGKYRDMYPNDDDLFEACFGRKPKGKIEVVKGPMTLFFRCFNENDYAFAYNFPKHNGDETLLKQEDIDRANLSAGMAINEVKINDLTGIITAENVWHDAPYLEIKKGVEKTEEIHAKKLLLINNQKEDIDIKVKGVGIWKVKIVERNEKGWPARIQFLNLNEIGAPPIFDVIRIEPAEKERSKTNSPGALKRVDDEKIQDHVVGYLNSGNQNYGNIDITYSCIEISDDSPHGAIIKYKKDEPILTPNDEESARTRIHEDQHHFDKLFKPLETREDKLTLMARVTEGAKTPEEATRELIRGLVRLARKQIEFDTSVRDEILAQYKEGEKTDGIFKKLTTLEIYDYVQKYQTEIDKIPASVKKELEKEVSEIFYVDNKDGKSTAAEANPLKIKEEDVLPHIEMVFKDEYQADLKKWLDAITALEKKGYTKDEIISLLYSEPVNSWPKLAWESTDSRKKLGGRMKTKTHDKQI